MITGMSNRHGNISLVVNHLWIVRTGISRFCTVDVFKFYNLLFLHLNYENIIFKIFIYLFTKYILIILIEFNSLM